MEEGPPGHLIRLAITNQGHEEIIPDWSPTGTHMVPVRRAKNRDRQTSEGWLAHPEMALTRFVIVA